MLILSVRCLCLQGGSIHLFFRTWKVYFSQVDVISKFSDLMKLKYFEFILYFDCISQWFLVDVTTKALGTQFSLIFKFLKNVSGHVTKWIKIEWWRHILLENKNFRHTTTCVHKCNFCFLYGFRWPVFHYLSIMAHYKYIKNRL